MNTNILLVHPLYGEATEARIFQPGVEFPISLTYLAAYLDHRGIENDILDLRLRPEPLQALREHIGRRKPFAVGITASTAAIENAAWVARRVKAIDKKIVTVIGGWHASALPEETLQRYADFDYLIHGEGEVALTDLLSSLAEGRGVDACKGLAFRRHGGIQVNPRGPLVADLNTLPLPAREKVRITDYHPNPGTRNYWTLPSTGILVGRGCPYNCLFCYKGVWGKGVRFRTPDNVLEEIELCIERYGIRDFRFYDDTITFPRWGLKQFCESIIRKKLDITWNCWSRVNDVNEEKLLLMKKAGCYHIKFGIEFGTEKALQLAHKGATLDQARKAIALCKKVKIECKGSFVFGIPGETLEDCQQTVRFALETSPHFATFYPFDPIPGSHYYQQIARGAIDPATGMLPPHATRRLADEAYKAFYFRAAFVVQRFRAFLLHPLRELSMVIDGAVMIATFLYRRARIGG